MGGIQATLKKYTIVHDRWWQSTQCIHQPLVWDGEHQHRIRRFHPPPTKWQWCLQGDVDSTTCQ